MNSIQRKMYIAYGNRKDEEHKKQLLEKDDKIQKLNHDYEMIQQKLYAYFEGDEHRTQIWKNPRLNEYNRTIGYNLRITNYEYNMMLTNKTFRREFSEYHIRKFIQDIEKLLK